ncbi:MAG: leucine-rich repeat protein, partial [Clostridia bacterium]|nr:leucine-rich repeat protein [Clostridia bacterium]
AEGEFVRAAGLTAEDFANNVYDDLAELDFYYADLSKNAYVLATRFSESEDYYYLSPYSDETIDEITELIIPAYIRKEQFSLLRELPDEYEYATVTKVMGFANTKLEKVVIPDTVTEISNRAFEHCLNLTEVTLSATLTTIGKNAFNSCSKLSSIVVPASVNTIGDNAFTECTVLKSATFEGDVATIGADIFYHAPVEIYGPDSGVLKRYCSDKGYTYNIGTRLTCFYYEKNEALTQIKITGLKAHNCQYGHSDIVIPDTIEGLPVTEIADEAFKNNLEIVSITIPATVKKIGSGVFSGCQNLMNVDSGSNPYYHFETEVVGTRLEYIVLYSGSMDTLISYFAASQAQIFEVPESVSKIASGSFAGATNLTDISIGANVSSIAADAFNGCSKLGTIDISPNNRYFSTDSKAIYNKDGTRLISYLSYNEDDLYEVKEGVEVIGERAFYENTTLQRVVISSSVKVIEARAFYAANRLVSVTVEGGLTSIGNEAFRGAVSLASFYVENDVAALGRDVFTGDSALIIYSPNGENLGLYAYNNQLHFNNCYSAASFTVEGNSEATTITALNMNDIYLGSSKSLNISIPPYIRGARVRAIGNEAFSETGAGKNSARLNSVYIPDTVTGIGAGAFRDCTKLKSVYFGGNMELSDIALDAFDGILPENLTFYFGDGAMELYDAFIADHDRFLEDQIRLVDENDCLEYDLGSNLASWVVTRQSQHICTKSHNFVTIPAEYEGTVVVNNNSETVKYPVTAVADSAFAGNSKIYTVTFEESSDDEASLMIGNSAFKDTRGLTSVTFASHTTSIGRDAFRNAVKLETLVLPADLESIGNYAFAGCTSLTSVFFRDDIKDKDEIGTAIFGLTG